MIYVTSFNGSKCEPLSQIGDDFEMVKSTDGTLTLSLTAFNDGNNVKNAGYDVLTSNSIITVDGYDFMATSFSSEIGFKSFEGVSTFYKHSKTRKHDRLEGLYTGQQRLNWLFNDLEYTFTATSEVLDKSVFSLDFGKDNVVALIQLFCSIYECEFEILPNKVVHFASTIGPDLDYQFRYKYNITDVVLKEDMTNIHTKIVGYGADGLTVTYESPNASQFGVLEAEPVKDDRYTVASHLLAYVKTQITDVPLIAIESKSVDITDRKLGELVWYIHEPLGIEMQTRIIEQTFKYRDFKLVCDSVIFGNSVPSTMEYRSVVQSEQQKALETVAITQKGLYNGVAINEDDGIRVDRSDGVVTVWLNATQGIRITNNGIQKFYVDTMGNVVMDGMLKITSNNATMLEAFMDTLGGRLIINDQYGNLNVKLGSEVLYSGSQGGMLQLFQDYKINPAVELGIYKGGSYTDGSGNLAIRDGTGKHRVLLTTYSDDFAGGYLGFWNTSGTLVTAYGQTQAYIAGQMVATQPWVYAAISSALASYSPPSSE